MGIEAATFRGGLNSIAKNGQSAPKLPIAPHYLPAGSIYLIVVYLPRDRHVSWWASTYRSPLTTSTHSGNWPPRMKVSHTVVAVTGFAISSNTPTKVGSDVNKGP